MPPRAVARSTLFFTLCRVPSSRSAMSERIGAHFAGSNTHDTVHADRPNFPVTDLAGAGADSELVDHRVEVCRVTQHLHLHLRQEVDGVFGTPVRLGLAALATEPSDL